MGYIFQKLVVISCCLVVFSSSGLDAMQAKNHSAHYFKQIRKLNKKSKQDLNYNQVLLQPCPVAMQLCTFATLKTQKPAPQNYEQKYNGQWVPVFTGFKSPWLAVLLASYLLIGEVNTQIDLRDGLSVNRAAREVLKIQQLTRIKFQQEFEVLRIERLKLEQNRLEVLNMLWQQKRVEELKQIAEQRKLEDLKIKRVQEQKKVEEGKIRQLLLEQQKNEKKKLEELKKPNEEKVENMCKMGDQKFIKQGFELGSLFADSEKTEVDVEFIDKQHFLYYCNLLGMFATKLCVTATLKEFAGKTATAQQILLIKDELDRQYILLSCFKVDKKYMEQAQELKKEMCTILLTNQGFSLSCMLDLAQKLITYLSFVRTAVAIAFESSNSIEERKKKALEKSSQLLEKLKTVQVTPNGSKAAFKLFAKDDLEKSIVMVGQDDLGSGGVAYAEGVNALVELFLKDLV